MILTCPSCGTQYVVKDGAIPEGGRQVRCASCKHSWHQDPEPLETAELTLTPDEEVPGEEPLTDTAVGEEVPPEQFAEPENPGFEVADAEEQSSTPSHLSDHEPEAEETPTEWNQPEDDEFAPFASRDEDEDPTPRSRGWLKLLLLVLFVAAAAAAFWFLAPPEWKSRVGVAQAGESELQLTLTKSQWQPLASGNTMLAVTGRIINPTDETQKIPPINAELRKPSGELVYRWTIAPPAASLPPGGRAPFNSAEVDVPAEGDLLTIAFAASA